MYLLQSPGYPERNKQKPFSFWVNVQADWSLCWLHRPSCRFCHALAQIQMVLVAVWLALSTLDFKVPGLNPAGGKGHLMTV